MTPNLERTVDIMMWVLFTPAQLTHKSKNKNIRRLGLFLILPYCITWVITGIPILLWMFVLGCMMLWDEA